jgi:hypothetical protein
LDAAVVTVWRGREANALREALRMSLDEFARHLGVSRRGVARWSAHPESRLRWDMQRALDHALAAAIPEAHQRFRVLLAAAPTHTPPPSSPAAPGIALTLAQGQGVQRDSGRVMARRLGAALVACAGATGAPTPALFRLERAVAQARMGFQACRYEAAAAGLPALMQAFAEAKADAAQRFPERVSRLASLAHQVTASLLLKVDDVPLALLAAERAVRAAGDQLTRAGATRVMVEALTHSGHAEQALALESTVDGGGPRELSVRGALHLARGLAAAHLGVYSRELDAAEALAHRVGGNFAWTGFGPANVRLHRAIAARVLGDPGRARRELSKVDPARLPYPERREAYFLEAAALAKSTPASSRC